MSDYHEYSYYCLTGTRIDFKSEDEGSPPVAGTLMLDRR